MILAFGVVALLLIFAIAAIANEHNELEQLLRNEQQIRMKNDLAFEFWKQQIEASVARITYTQIRTHLKKGGTHGRLKHLGKR